MKAWLRHRHYRTLHPNPSCGLGEKFIVAGIKLNGRPTTLLALSRDAFGSSLFARFASSQHLDILHLTFSFFAPGDLCSGLRALDYIDDSFPLLIATLFVFHQVVYDLLVP